MSRTTWCFIIGDIETWPVKIDFTETVSHLKKEIKQENPDLNTPGVTLYRAAVDESINKQRENRMNEPNRLCQDLKEYKELDDEQHLLGDIFDEVPQGKICYVLVRTPEAAHSLKRKADDQTSASDAPPGKKLKGLLSGDDMITDSLNQDSYPLLAAMSQISSIYEAIQSIGKIDFASPDLFRELPFPSPIPLPYERFSWSKPLGGVDSFQYIGREMFAQLQDSIRQPDIQNAFNRLCLYGPTGTGKSHLLAALVCQLVLDNERVFYIPDCRRLVENTFHHIRNALLFAFHGDRRACSKIAEAKTLDQLLSFQDSQPPRSAYFVIDQWNALEFHDPNDPNRAHKEQVLQFLNAIGTGQKYIYSAASNEQASVHAEGKQWNIRTLYFRSGMSQDEMTKWWDRNKAMLPNLDDSDRGWVEEITGCIPLFLKPLFQFSGQEFDGEKFLRCAELETVQKNIRTFYQEKKFNAPEDLLLSSMKACLLEQNSMSQTGYYDKRYFYFEGRVGHAACGLARLTLLPIYRELQLSTIGDGSWYRAILSSNPTVRGYLAEQVCLATITHKGFSRVGHDLGGPMRAEYFTSIPFWSNFIQSGDTVRLYLPKAFNYPAIDAAILQLDRTQRKARLFPIQVTLAKNHKDSELLFYQTKWGAWAQGLDGFEVESTFVWIDNHRPRQSTVQMEEMALPARNVKNQLYSSIHIGVADVDQHLFNVLNTETK